MQSTSPGSAADAFWAIATAVRLAKKHNVAIGAHPGFPDLPGFGRRHMALSEEEVADIIIFQVGAVKAFCDLEGVKLVSCQMRRLSLGGHLAPPAIEQH